MTTQHSLFEGQRLCDEGIERVEAKGAEWLAEARLLVEALWRERDNQGRYVHRYGITVNDIRRLFPLPDGLHVNTYGALFRDPRFVPIGDAQTTHPAGHSRRVRRWALRRA